MQETAADISDTMRDFGWTPKVPVEEGIPLFVEWFKSYNRLYKASTVFLLSAGESGGTRRFPLT